MHLLVYHVQINRSTRWKISNLQKGNGKIIIKRNLFYDGFNSKLIETACFEGQLEIPVLSRPDKISIPTGAIPFSERKKHSGSSEMLVFYEHDFKFRELVSIPQKYIEEIKKFNYVSTPDCSVYTDMPLIFQIANIAVSRSIGYYFQQEGLYVIPNARWGDERTYTDMCFDIPPAFAGLPENSIVSIGSYGCSKRREDRYHLKHGLQAMIDCIHPEAVIVYGSYSDEIFKDFEKATNFYHIHDWISQKKGRDV